MDDVSNKQINMQQVALALCRARTKYAMSLRSLAREENLSASQLWRVENAQEGASDRVLDIYARRFRLDRDEIYRLAGRLPSDLKEHLVSDPRAVQRVRRDMNSR